MADGNRPAGLPRASCGPPAGPVLPAHSTGLAMTDGNEVGTAASVLVTQSQKVVHLPPGECEAEPLTVSRQRASPRVSAWPDLGFGALRPMTLEEGTSAVSGGALALAPGPRPPAHAEVAALTAVTAVQPPAPAVHQMGLGAGWGGAGGGWTRHLGQRACGKGTRAPSGASRDTLTLSFRLPPVSQCLRREPPLPRRCSLCAVSPRAPVVMGHEPPG